jgi:hypothetical protein
MKEKKKERERKRQKRREEVKRILDCEREQA